MRVLHLLASPVFSGPAELVLELARLQREAGHQVTVAIDRLRQGTDSEEPAEPRFRAAGLLDETGLELSVKSSPARALSDARRLRARALDVVHSHFSHDHVVARLAVRRGRLLVRSLHAPRSLRWSMPRADAFTVPEATLIRRLPKVPSMVLPALISADFTPADDRLALRARLQLGGEPLVGMVSTFQASRRHALALEAFARLKLRAPAARLVLLGDGALGASLRVQAERLGISGSVTFAGYRNGLDFVSWLQALDEVWLLGLGNDHSARAAVQARACGVRVVAVDEGALAAWADAVVPATIEGLEAAVGASTRRQLPLPDSGTVCKNVMALYAEASA